MAERILVSTEAIQQTITAYNSAKDNKLNAINAMESAINTLDATWDGMASEAFFSSFRVLKNNLMSSDTIMTDAVTKLTKVAELATDADSSIQSSGSGLDTGTAFEF